MKARKENAELAKSMLEYISTHEDELVSLCFSKSFIGGDFNNKSKENMHKFSLVKDIAYHYYSKIKQYHTDYKFTIENILELSQQGQPTGPSSVYWLLQNLDKVMTSNSEEAKLKINNRMYTIDEMPSEHIEHNTDVFENRVINSFFFSAKEFLTDLKKKYQNHSDYQFSEKIKTDDSVDFVSFDHILSSFKSSIINHHIDDINALIVLLNKLILLMKNKLACKFIPQLRPRMTSFVLQRPHYRKLFIDIDKWYNASAPNLNKSNTLLGLRNLSAIYEISTLLMLSKDIPNIFDVKLNKKSYRNYTDNLSFDGEEVERPIDKTNNYFSFSNDNGSFELLLEPKIYGYKKGTTQVNDLINISNRNATSFGRHFYSPDYVLRIYNLSWKEPLVIILDAKYSNRNTVMKYSLSDTTDKYLHNLFQFKEDNTVGISPIKLVMILYAHGADTPASFLNKMHYVNGDLPVYPQSVGLKYIPNESGRVLSWLSTAVKHHHDRQIKHLI